MVFTATTVNVSCSFYNLRIFICVVGKNKKMFTEVLGTNKKNSQVVSVFKSHRNVKSLT